MLGLAPIPWPRRIWALLFLTALVPSERACRERGRRHKPLLDVGRQLALQAGRWLPGRDLVVVGDGGFSALLFLDAMRRARIAAIARTTPRLLALSSIITLLAARLPARQWRRVAAAAWYPKPRSTFADALAAVRCAIWRERTLATSPRRHARTKPPFRLPAP